MTGIQWDIFNVGERRPLRHATTEILVEEVEENFCHQSLNARSQAQIAAEELLYRADHLDPYHFENDPGIRLDIMDDVSDVEIGRVVERMKHTITVDGRFTREGISVSAYGHDDGNVLDETWFTWDEVEEMKSDDESHFTFEL